MNATVVAPAPVQVAEPLLTADEFMRLHGGESHVDLVKGRVVRLPMPGSPHGYINNNVSAILTPFVRQHKLGRVFTNDTFVRVRLKEATDSLRGADVAFMSFAKMPPGDVPEGPFPVAPELVVEVRSPSDRTGAVNEKVEEYLEAGVTVVVVLDPATKSLAVYRTSELPVRMDSSDELTLPDVLPGFAVQVKQFFE